MNSSLSFHPTDRTSDIASSGSKLPPTSLPSIITCLKASWQTSPTASVGLESLGDTVYHGGRIDAELLCLIRNAIGNEQLQFCYDEHEKRLREDVRQFRRLLRNRG